MRIGNVYRQCSGKINLIVPTKYVRTKDYKNEFKKRNVTQMDQK